jgi:hypothetical protein
MWFVHVLIAKLEHGNATRNSRIWLLEIFRRPWNVWHTIRDKLAPFTRLYMRSLWSEPPIWYAAVIVHAHLPLAVCAGAICSGGDVAFAQITKVWLGDDFVAPSPPLLLASELRVTIYTAGLLTN